MKVVITGKSRLSSKNMEAALGKLSGDIKNIRFVNDLELLAVAAVGSVLDDAGIRYPVGNASIGVYPGIDDSVEDIKDGYFNNVLKEGLLGASPLLFPFTSPNALAAFVSIAFDIRGESITFPIKHSFRDVIKYGTDCILENHTIMAIAGGIIIKDKKLAVKDGRYTAEFFLLEEMQRAVKRGARIYKRKCR
ncbi:MAG: hypothetical protein HZA14_10765 [Nitrospirae bacterium]|nr:hypothetical protein [Nitrospirota bacterium]